ncbi:MAG: hypothetical protein QOK44_654, partial [Betaproteobacteria bacterium]|nr:hypothetical protein [Betaproteobacteria bacterium]
MEGFGVMCELLLRQPVLAHEFVRPTWLADLFAWEELNDDRLDVEYWRSIDCVELCNDELGAFNPNDTADGAANAV